MKQNMSLPSERVIDLNISEVENLSSEFVYNFFVPDESVNESGGVPAAFLQKQTETIDNNFIAVSGRLLPRFIKLNWKPVSFKFGNNFNSLSTIKIKDNLSSIVSESSFNTKDFIMEQFQDNQLDGKLNYLTTNILENKIKIYNSVIKAQIAQQQTNLNLKINSQSYLDKARLLNTLTPDSVTSDFIVQALNQIKYLGAHYISDQQKTNIIQSSFDQIKNLKFPSRFNKKIIDQIVLSSIEDWKNAFPSVFEQGGFSVIIGNPPYVRGENLEESSRNNLREMYPDLFLGHIDIYSAFIRRAVDLLKNNGLFEFIISNKWMRAKYGRPLRKLFLEEGNILELINFSDYRVFEDATVDTVIILFEKEKDENKTKILSCVVNEDFNNFINNRKNLFDYISDKSIEIENTSLSEDSFLLLTREEYDLKKKIESVEKPLRDWDIKIYFGIKTGFNEAFIIDEKTKRNILSNCKTKEEKEKTEELIKPILRGRDIGKYCYNWAKLYIIIIPAGWTNTNKEKDQGGEDFFKSILPSLYNYLSIAGKNTIKGKKKGLFNRDDQGDYWWELRPCDYYSEFEKEKIVWQRVSQEQKFTLVSPGQYCEATTHIITGSNLKYLLGIFNSTLFKFCFYKFYMGGGIEGEIKGEFIGKFPIIPITKENIYITSQIESLVTQILNEKQENNTKDTSELESQIDELIYKLYQLTPEEIEIINK